MTSVTYGELILPAIRARMGDWIYYTTAMRLSDVATRVSFASEIHQSASLKDLLQRSVSNRSADVAEYLISQEQRFFSSIVVGAYGGNPTWNEISITSQPPYFSSDLPNHLEGMLGFLVLDGSEKLFAIDGQHRVAGIRQAIQGRESLAAEEVGIILVSAVPQEVRQNDSQKFERTRRLFSTLNRYAKPVSKSDIIALDEDDVVAIVTRKVIDEFPLFENRISIGPATSINQQDRRNFTNITTLYDALNEILRPGSQSAWAKVKKVRPSEQEVERYERAGIELWETYVKHFPELNSLSALSELGDAGLALRSARGGHLLFRPVGLLATVRAARALMDVEGISLDQAVSRVSEIPKEVSSEPWVGILWDAGNNRMLTTRENQAVARRLIFHLAGGDLERQRSNVGKLRSEMAGILNKSEDEVEANWLMR